MAIRSQDREISGTMTKSLEGDKMITFAALILLGIVSVIFTVIVLAIWFNNRKKTDDGE